VAVSFIGGGTQRKQQACRKSQTNYHIIIHVIELLCLQLEICKFLDGDLVS